MITKLYRLALLMLPGSFRRKYGRDMELAFDEVLRGNAGLSRVTALVRGIVDIPRASWLLRRESRENARNVTARRRRPVESLLNDLAHGASSLVKRPAFALVAVATLSLGIGSVTAVFSVVNGVLLKPLPYVAADRIVILWHDLGNGAQTLPALNPLDLFDYRDRARGFEEWTIATGRELILGDESEPALVDVGFVAENFLSFFGVELLLGRSFTGEEDAPGGPDVAILSHRLWTGRFGGDPGIVGRTIELGGRDHEVIGVAAAAFRLKLPAEAFRLRDAEIWCPAQIDRDELPPRNYTGYTGFGKLEPGTSFEQAQQEMDRLEAQLKQEHAVHEASNLQVRAVPLHGDVVKAARPTLYVLLAAVGLVLLIACGNTAQLLLARWRGGERELTVRAAMGASRWRLTRLVMIESIVLALVSGGIGVGTAHASLGLVRKLASSSVPRLEEVSLDGTVLLFAVLTSLATALFFSAVPALSLSRTNLASLLAQSGRSSGSVRQARLRTALIVCEVALSVVLLAATGLSIRSFAALVEAEPGFDPSNLLTLRVSLPSLEFDEDDTRRVFHEEMQRRIATLPGVAAVAEVNQLPLTGSGTLQPYAYDEETATNWESVTADERYVSPGFFRAMGATLLAGRDFTEDDLRLERKVAVIDEALAEKAFPGQDPIGKQIRVEPLGEDDPFTEVIGVTAHLKLHDLTRATLPQFYFPARPSWSFSLAVRSATGEDLGTLSAAVRDEVRTLAPGAAIEDVVPMERLVAAARAQARLSLVLMVGFGALALLLAAVGLFGVLAYAVSSRRTELGIRMAIGASPAAIRRGVLGEGLRVVAASTAVGLVGAVLAARWLSGILYGIDALDAATFVGVAAIVTAVAVLACWVPARRATRVAPALVLKST